MARIFISYFSDYGEAMYDAISSVLVGNGNDILRLNINIPEVKRTYWGGESYLSDDGILAEIKIFNPEIVFNFNHSLPYNVYSILSETCKVCVIDADNPETFWNKDVLRKNKDEYVYLGLQSYSKSMYESFFSGKQIKNYLYFPPATIVKNIELKQDKNISFIGSNFYPLEVPVGEDFYTKDALELYDKLKNDYYFPIEKLGDIGRDWESKKWVYEKVRAYYVGQDRLKYLQCLTDLGFTLYGVRWWNRIAYYDFDIAKCFDSTPQVSIEENQWVYNTSKISVNISHPQAKSSFSWRVMDIMASNACLLMEDKPDWKALFAKYLSDETLSSIIYKDRYDMRSKAIVLLKDEALRRRCVKDLNKAIEKAGRWEHRFKNLEAFVNLKLVSTKKGGGRYIYINKHENQNKLKNVCNSEVKEQLIKSVEELRSISFKSRWKVFSYSLLLVASQLPIVDLVINKRQRNRILRAIYKYWH